MPVSPDLPRPREPRDQSPSVVKSNIHKILLAFPFIDPRITDTYLDRAAFKSAKADATRAVRAPWIAPKDKDTAEYITSITYNTETGEIGKPPAVYEAGEWSRIEIRLLGEGGDYRAPTSDMQYTLLLQLSDDDKIPPHTFHEFDPGSTENDVAKLADVGRMVLPQRLYLDSEGINRRHSFSRWQTFGDVLLLETIAEFNKTYGRESVLV